MLQYFQKISELLAANTPFVSATVVDTTGSAPSDVGNKMLVVDGRLYYGTVGGGALEKRAIGEAQLLLKGGSSGRATCFVDWSLAADLGMNCGGAVKLFFEACNVSRWGIAVFGAGHVACALINQLLLLECRVTCIDPRQEWLDKLPNSPKLTKVLAADMPTAVQDLHDRDLVVIITMGYDTDLPILLECLKSRNFPYVGVIGSAAKASRLRSAVGEAGLPTECQSSFICPIGLPIGSNHPQEIAISIVAQLLQERDCHL